MRFCYKDIKEIRVLVTSYRNPAALTETVKESQLVAEQKRPADPGSHRNPLLSSLGTWSLCVLFPLLLLVQAILLPSRVSFLIISEVRRRVALSLPFLSGQLQQVYMQPPSIL